MLKNFPADSFRNTNAVLSLFEQIRSSSVVDCCSTINDNLVGFIIFTEQGHRRQPFVLKQGKAKPLF